MATVKTTCPLDCWDQCALVVEKRQGMIVSIKPDPQQAGSGPLICSKGKSHADRVNHPQRLLYPLIKDNGVFKRISWPEALKKMAAAIDQALANAGPLSLMHFFDAGHNGLLKNMESRFFSALGGCTLHQGSLCWGAGVAAQNYDFGASKAHPYHDLLNSRLILIWGRNPAHTSINLKAYIGKARRNGARVVLIDPVRTGTADLADEHLSIKPGTDGVLALAMAGYIIANNLADRDFIDQCSTGFEKFLKLCQECSLPWAAEVTGLDEERIKQLALAYAAGKPAAILIGIGLQRHSNGGNIIRAIDALAALTGNVGLPGGGANYANFRIAGYIDQAFLKGEDLNPRRRFYPKPRLAKSLLELSEPAIRFLYISRSNPLVQVGDLNLLRKGFSKVPFIVTADHFMTDTAAASDLVLPATCFLEEEDLYYNSMSHQYLSYGNRVLEPKGECRSEYDFFGELSSLMALKGYPDWTPQKIMARALQPLTKKTGITVEQVKEKGPILLPGGDEVPWADRIFETTDQKYHFYSSAAEKDGADALPLYRPPGELNDRSLQQEGYIYWFVTPHPRQSIHSIHRLPGDGKEPLAYINPQTAKKEGLKAGTQILVSSKRGSIEVAVAVSADIPPHTVLVYEGWWHESKAAVNRLTSGGLTDMGLQAAYYDCLCRIDPL